MTIELKEKTSIQKNQLKKGLQAAILIFGLVVMPAFSHAGLSENYFSAQQSANTPNLQLLSLAVNGSLYQKQTGSFIATLKNNGNATYNSRLWVYMEKPITYSPNQRIGGDVVSISVGETKTITISGTITLPPAIYSCNMIQDINNNPSNMATQQFDGTILGIQVTVQEPTYPESDYNKIRESKHFIFEVPYKYLQNQISPFNLQRWLSHLDAVYESYEKLVGNVPCNGQKIHIVEATGTMYGWAWVYGGYPYIYWNPNYIASELKSIHELDNWSFGILHEIGHLFDKDTEPNWIFHGEVTANLKVIYAIDALVDCKYEMGGFRYSLQDMYDYFYNWAVQDNGEDDRFTDKISLTFINVARRYGWSLFTKAFKSYWDNSYPYTSNCMGYNKYNDFVDRLEYFSGSSNIRNECFNVGNWLATIERHYPNTPPATTWQIGSPVASNVIATFDKGILSIQGTGAMQGSMSWDCERDNIISVVIQDGITTIGDRAFNGCPNLTNVTIPNSVQTIGEFAFSWCHKLSSLTIGNSVKYISNHAFERCYDLTSLSLPNSLQTIDEAAFFNCVNLKSVIIPNSVQSIGRGVFSYCTNLNSVTIGNSVTNLGMDAFDQCGSLKDMTVRWVTPLLINRNVFGSTNISNVNLHVPEGYQCTYAEAPIWQDFNIVPDCVPSHNDNVTINKISIFPNPAKDEIFITTELSIVKVEIYSLTGVLMFSENNFSEKISVSALPTGIYFLKINTNKGLVASKIVKE